MRRDRHKRRDWGGTVPGHRISSDAGVTLIELMVVTVIMMAISSIGIVIYLNQQVRAQDAVAESEIAEVSRYLEQASASGYVVQTGNIPLAIPGQGFLAAFRSSVVTDPNTPGNYCIRTLSESGKVFYFESDQGRLTSTPPSYCLSAPIPTPDPVSSDAPAPPVITPDQDVVLDLTSGEAAVAGTGTFTDQTNGAIIERSSDSTRFYIAAANWKTLRVDYVGTDGLPYTYSINKSGPSTSGILTRLSTKDVRIALPITTPFTVTVEYAGNSTGAIYTLTPA